MLCFIVKRRSRFEKSIDRRNGKHRDKLCEMLWPDRLCRQPSSPPQERCKRRLGDGEPQLRFTSSGRRDDAGRSVPISLAPLVEERRSWTASSAKIIAGGSKRLHSNSRGLQLRLKKRSELSFDSSVASSRVRWDLLSFDSEEKACSRQAAMIP
ncbi:hypothetical protein BHE74_00056459 [Ensete ventricosum]|nr:hypothetical protein BHE74_00056459 [Ensete ventricosum]